MSGSFDLRSTFVHLGLNSLATPLPNFSWSREYLMKYLRDHIKERDERRLLGIVPVDRSWTHWECHAGGDEVVVQLSGRCDIIQDLDDGPHVIALSAGQAMINPRGVWHTSDVHEPGESLFIAAGRTTRYRPRRSGVAAAGAPTGPT